METEGPPTSKDLWLERLSAVLFFTQIVHLIWMTTYVIPIQLGSSPIWSPPEAPLALADYLELPAIVATSILYIRTRNWKMLFLVNVQLFHIFWITDEFVLDRGTLVPVLAWIAIFIDYLELPVIVDTIRRAARGFLKQPAPEEG
ncbi:MAG TPA: hypothetical protein VFV09_09820 [Actinomycetota bacterium]|jgi:hypothetical protein|nr:hypothetical protein [Actinomycetota bacterium]